MSLEKEVSEFRGGYWTFEETSKKSNPIAFLADFVNKKACLNLHAKAWNFDRQEEDKQQSENRFYFSIAWAVRTTASASH